jgi:hypothetical protein
VVDKTKTELAIEAARAAGIPCEGYVACEDPNLDGLPEVACKAQEEPPLHRFLGAPNTDLHATWSAWYGRRSQNVDKCVTFVDAFRQMLAPALEALRKRHPEIKAVGMKTHHGAVHLTYNIPFVDEVDVLIGQVVYDPEEPAYLVLENILDIMGENAPGGEVLLILEKSGLVPPETVARLWNKLKAEGR